MIRDTRGGGGGGFRGALCFWGCPQGRGKGKGRGAIPCSRGSSGGCTPCIATRCKVSRSAAHGNVNEGGLVCAVGCSSWHLEKRTVGLPTLASNQKKPTSSHGQAMLVAANHNSWVQRKREGMYAARLTLTPGKKTKRKSTSLSIRSPVDRKATYRHESHCPHSPFKTCAGHSQILLRCMWDGGDEAYLLANLGLASIRQGLRHANLRSVSALQQQDEGLQAAQPVALGS